MCDHCFFFFESKTYFSDQNKDVKKNYAVVRKKVKKNNSLMGNVSYLNKKGYKALVFFSWFRKKVLMKYHVMKHLKINTFQPPTKNTSSYIQVTCYTLKFSNVFSEGNEKEKNLHGENWRENINGMTFFHSHRYSVLFTIIVHNR